ncbi:MAG: proton-conducting transporter membrane subunit [Gemmataceae bacterium]
MTMTAWTAVRAKHPWEPLAWLGLLGLLLLSLAGLVVQTLDPTPLTALGLRLDRLTAALAVLVALVGLVTFRFSLRYLAGESRQPIFLRRFAFTVVAAWLFMLASNLVLLFVAWLLTSLFLHGLLIHFSDRAEAHGPAWTKFAISRLGDLLLLGAIAGIAITAGTLDLYAYLEWSRTEGTATWIALLLVLAALTKSAQVPFHIWLPETLEAPTPVSALMHAGIINAGGALLLRFAPVLVNAPYALALLALVGTLTAVLGALAMWSQVKAKRVLAWSTVSQMGFMMVQLGLAAFPSALLHLIGHGLYKAHAFLRIGGVPVPSRLQANAPGWKVTLLTLGAILSLPLMQLALWLTGFEFRHSGEWALALIVGLASSQLWVALLGPRFWLRGLLITLGLQAVVLIFAFAIYRGAMWYLAPVLGTLQLPPGELMGLSATFVVLAFATLTYLHVLFPWLIHTRFGFALHLHALHGFYLGPWIESCWRRPIPRQTTPGSLEGRQPSEAVVVNS